MPDFEVLLFRGKINIEAGDHILMPKIKAM